MQNEKVRDEHSSVTPCQHSPQHPPQSVTTVPVLPAVHNCSLVSTPKFLGAQITF